MNREEAINVVRCNWPEGRHQLSEALRTLIPEFQVSEDERIRKMLISLVKHHADILEQQYEKDILAYLERQKEYIEDIRQYAYNKGLVDAEEKQKPAELSDEDEAMLKEIISFFKDGSVKLQHDLDLYAGFLENRFKSLRPQPHWKPSKEQLEALKLIVSNKAHYAPVLHEIALDTLYSDLKKL